MNTVKREIFRAPRFQKVRIDSSVRCITVSRDVAVDQ